MRFKRPWLALAVAACCAAGAGTLTARWLARSVPLPSPPEQLGLSIEPQGLDFGEVWATSHFEWNLPVRNDSGSEASVQSLLGDCSCVTAGSFPVRIGAGESKTIKLYLDLTKRCMGRGADPFAAVPHPIKLSASVIIQNTHRQFNWALDGRVKPVVLPSAREIDFGRLWNAPSLERSVPLHLAPGIEVRAAKLVGEGYGLVPEIRRGDKTSELVVRLPSLGPPSRYKCEVQIIPVTRTGEPIDLPPIPVNWEVLHEVQPDTTTVDFGVLTVGAVSEKTLTLSSLNGKPFRVTRCQIDAPGGAVAAPEPATSLPVLVSRRIDRTGDQTGEVHIEGVTDTGASFTIKCRTHYFGVNPASP